VNLISAEPDAGPDPHIGFFLFQPHAARQRVHDILTAVAWLHARPKVQRVDLVGLQEAGLCLLAAACAMMR